MIHVLATIQVVEGKRSAFLEQFAGVVPLVRAEAGCLEYGAAVDVPTPIAVQSPVRSDVVMVIEKWASLEALQAHLQAPHMLAYRQRISGLVKSVTLQILEPASA